MIKYEEALKIVNDMINKNNALQEKFQNLNTFIETVRVRQVGTRQI